MPVLILNVIYRKKKLKKSLLDKQKGKERLEGDYKKWPSPNEKKRFLIHSFPPLLSCFHITFLFSPLLNDLPFAVFYSPFAIYRALLIRCGTLLLDGNASVRTRGGPGTKGKNESRHDNCRRT
jgi:hypothetical protein